ncbi:MAG: TlpA disulfide reductase family protein [Mangrovicoccus sp.]
MKLIWSAALYTALALSANAGPAIEDLREGSLKKLVFAETPKIVTGVAFETEDGTEISLDDFRGQYALVNFWATWCAPCRKEMPSLDALQAEFGGEAFQVVTIATGRQSPAAIKRFFDEEGIENLPQHRDPRQALASRMGILGLPITVLIDPEGREIARLRGDADWHSDSARAIISALIKGDS